MVRDGRAFFAPPPPAFDILFSLFARIFGSIGMGGRFSSPRLLVERIDMASLSAYLARGELPRRLGTLPFDLARGANELRRAVMSGCPGCRTRSNADIRADTHSDVSAKFNVLAIAARLSQSR